MTAPHLLQLLNARINALEPKPGNRDATLLRAMLLVLVFRILNSELFTSLCTNKEIQKFINTTKEDDIDTLYNRVQEALYKKDGVVSTVCTILIQLGSYPHASENVSHAPAVSLLAMQQRSQGQWQPQAHLSGCVRNLHQATSTGSINPLLFSLKARGEKDQKQELQQLLNDFDDLDALTAENAFHVDAEFPVEFLAQKLFPKGCVKNERNLCDLSNFRTVLVEHESRLHSFLFAPILPHEGDSLWKRLHITLRLIAFVRQLMAESNNIRPVRLCVLSGRFEPSGLTRRYVREAAMLRENLPEYLPKYLATDGLDPFADNGLFEFIEHRAEHNGSRQAGDQNVDAKPIQSYLSYKAEAAFANADIIIAPDGTVGNLMIRTMCLNDGSPWTLAGVPWFVEDSRWLPLPAGEGRFASRADFVDVHRSNASLWTALKRNRNSRRSLFRG